MKNTHVLRFLVLSTIFIAILFFAPRVFAGGKIVSQVNYGIETESMYLQSVGIQVNETVMGPVLYNAYMGYGVNQYTDREDLQWTVMRQGVDVKLTRDFTMGTGVSVGFVFPDNNFNNAVYLKASYDLW